MSTRTLTAAVAGGGLGGLTVATALAQRGWDVELLEQADELRAFGAGIWLWANGMRALENIGAYDRLMARDGLHASAWEIRDRNNRLIRRRESRGKDELYVPRRTDLHEVLVESAVAAGVKITCGARVVSGDPGGSVRLEDGTVVTADLIVAADGVRSRVRDSLGLAKEVHETGLGVTRMLVPRSESELKDDVVLENWHGDRGLLYNPCTRDETYLCFGGPITDAEANEVPLNVAAWQETFPRYAEILERARGIDGHWDELTVVRCHKWTAGRVAIIGDAAHGLPPTLGQGANLSFSNAVALAAAVSKVGHSQIPAALKVWERTVRPISDHTQRWSEFYNKIAWLFPGRNERMKLATIRFVLQVPGIERRLDLATQTTWQF